MSCKEVKEIVRELRRNDWTVTVANNGHYRARHPAGGVVFISATPSARSAMTNIRADIRRIERKQETEYAAA